MILMFPKRFTTTMWCTGSGEVKGHNNFLHSDSTPTESCLRSEHELRSESHREQLSAGPVGAACSASLSCLGPLWPSRRNRKRGHGLWWPPRLGPQGGVFHIAPPPGDPAGHSKPLLMSSAKMMLVRRAGWDRRAWTTAFWEHCRSSGPSGSMLATSGRVDDLWGEDKTVLSEAIPWAQRGPEAKATAPT